VAVAAKMNVELFTLVDRRAPRPTTAKLVRLLTISLSNTPANPNLNSCQSSNPFSITFAHGVCLSFGYGGRV